MPQKWVKYKQIKEENRRMNLKKQEGITLTILVITILVILLIVGTSVGTILSRKGLLKSAQEAQKVQQNEAEKEEQKTNNLIDRVGELRQIGPSEKEKSKQQINQSIQTKMEIKLLSQEGFV